MIDENYIKGVNTLVCEESNQKSIVLNEGMLSSAVGVQQWFETSELRSSSLIRSLIINHPFRDGNKRTAFLVLVTISNPTVSQEIISDVILQIAKGNLSDPHEICDLLFL